MLRATRSIVAGTVGTDVRAGVNVGPVFVGNLGSATRRTFTVMGDAVNLAARLMQKAEEGQVVASNAVLDRSSTSFGVDGLEPFLVKGKTAPIYASVVHEPRERREQERRLPLSGATHSCESCSRAPWALVRAKAGSSRSSASPARGRPDCSRSYATASPSFGSSRPSADGPPRTTPYFAIRPGVAVAGRHRARRHGRRGRGPPRRVGRCGRAGARHLAAPRCDSLRYRDGSHRRGDAHGSRNSAGRALTRQSASSSPAPRARPRFCSWRTSTGSTTLRRHSSASSSRSLRRVRGSSS